MPRRASGKAIGPVARASSSPRQTNIGGTNPKFGWPRLTQSSSANSVQNQPKPGQTRDEVGRAHPRIGRTQNQLDRCQPQLRGSQPHVGRAKLQAQPEGGEPRAWSNIGQALCTPKLRTGGGVKSGQALRACTSGARSRHQLGAPTRVPLACTPGTHFGQAPGERTWGIHPRDALGVCTPSAL